MNFFFLLFYNTNENSKTSFDFFDFGRQETSNILPLDQGIAAKHRLLSELEIQTSIGEKNPPVSRICI